MKHAEGCPAVDGFGCRCGLGELTTVSLPIDVWMSVLGCLQSDLESDSYAEHPGLLDDLGMAIAAIETVIDNTPNGQ